jgi:photosystem II stability/assembly factor-like uncharacterized protein
MNNVIFAVGDGLYRSMDGGSSWRLLRGGYDMTVRIHPLRPDQVFVTRLNNMNGIYMSTDNGSHFRMVSHGLMMEISDMQFHPFNPNVLYATSLEIKSVLKSTDAGVTWTNMKSDLSNSCCDEVEVDPKNGNIVYVRDTAGDLFGSSDGGLSWNLIHHFQRWISALAIDPNNPNILYAAGDQIYKSTDRGANWVGAQCQCYANSIAVAPWNSNAIFATSQNYHGSLIRSLDGGKSWITHKVPAQLAWVSGAWGVAIDPHAANIVFLGANGIGRSMDGGVSIQTVNEGVAGLNIDRVQINGRGQILSTSYEGQAFIGTRDGWHRILQQTDEISDLRIHPKNRNLVVATTPYSGLAISTDGGNTWIFKKNSVYGASKLLLDPHSENILYLSAFGGSVFKSTDRGNTFHRADSGLPGDFIRSFTIDPVNGSNLFVGTQSSGIYRTENGGKNWKQINQGLGYYDVTAIAVSPESSKNVYAFAGSCCVQHVLVKSTDKGNTWTSQAEGLPPLAFPFIAFDPSDPKIMYVGAEPGVFVSTDSGNNFIRFNSVGLAPLRSPTVVSSSFDMTIDSFSHTLVLGAKRGVFSFTLAAP